MGEAIWVVLACVLRATTKKGRQLFGGRKVHPRQNPGYAYGSSTLRMHDNKSLRVAVMISGTLVNTQTHTLSLPSLRCQ